MKPLSQIIALGGLCFMVLASNTAAAHDAPHRPQFKSLGEAEATPFPGHDVQPLVKGDELAADLAMMELVVPPKTLGAPPHIHTDEDEVFVVLEGSVTFLNGEDQVTMCPDGAAILPRGHWHGFWNASDEPAKLLLTVSPQNFEGFFDEVVMTLRREKPAGPQAVGAIIGKVAASRNVTVDPRRFPPEALALMPK